jgi:hypothetical protein
MKFSRHLKSLLPNSLDQILPCEEARLLWTILKELNVSCDPEVFEVLDKDSIIEVYNADDIQVYRNQKFHEVFNYDFITLFSSKRKDLFSRNEFFDKQIDQALSISFSMSESEIIDLTKIRPHAVNQKLADQPSSLLVSINFICPLINKLNVAEYSVLVYKVHTN